MGDSTYPGPLGRANSIVADRPDGLQSPAQKGYAGQALAAELLAKIFKPLEMPITVRVWNGPAFRVGGCAVPGAGAEPARAQRAGAQPPFVLWFRSPSAVVSMVLGRDPLRLADAYFRGEVDIEGDLFAALALKDHLQEIKLPLGERWAALLMALKLRSLNRGSEPGKQAHAQTGAERSLAYRRTVRAHSGDANREAIRFHYDVSNEFYKLWLDRAMVYSCGYFEHSDVGIDEAQQAKLEHICRKLLLQPGERFLDIGCGWGALVIHAARHHGVRAHGITLSSNQLELARARIAAAGLEDRVTVELCNYRDLDRETLYDKVASVGMFEHVGLDNLPAYFGTVQRVLAPGGLFLNHGITHRHSGWDHNLSTEFINRYVFPDAQLDAISNIQRFMEDAEFEIADVEGLRPHYALTLRAWVGRLEQRHARALEYVSEATYRVWRLYMAASALEFESGNLGIYQILARKRGAESESAVPLTRRHLYVQQPCK
jgi:cyclopropane-fatty-acyl-phospholipid synthase